MINIAIAKFICDHIIVNFLVSSFNANEDNIFLPIVFFIYIMGTASDL
jgi:hypothetical protein